MMVWGFISEHSMINQHICEGGCGQLLNSWFLLERALGKDTVDVAAYPQDFPMEMSKINKNMQVFD